MDTTDPEIEFDELGYCSNCSSALELARKIWFPDEKGEKILDNIFERIKQEEKKKNLTVLLV